MPPEETFKEGADLSLLLGGGEKGGGGPGIINRPLLKYKRGALLARGGRKRGGASSYLAPKAEGCIATALSYIALIKGKEKREKMCLYLSLVNVKRKGETERH